MLYRVSVSFHKDYVKIQDDHIEIGIMAKPVKGEANLEIIKKIAKHFGISKSNVRIVAGEKSRDKVVEVISSSTKP
ncbi:MAG: DUF167 domain-containing protein [Thaumarchaeota archaeon]|nr:DUF167 domain-containing protein [Nitrososphaerota archaeon]